ncbi:nucleotidyltransferase domain-containing protein [Allokutzneria sp. A3M-2-11 16]|uniref:nucleotidyltransferase domain-containing protein n=1 Tax=Allokutzneria sp. A3M-2-11 16 TaxID=2962043 RepID=UPI0020B7107A|nr:nucleotidyltransferase domain-containing protein [Allokutzneria sp. A3M-2-11 16]MCP3802144.1 nucleotidyltransferase domain-containing protein [Allokutzneria sp. A3M-2-11 16]
MKHSSPEFAAIAERGTILLSQVGSGVHGTAIAGTDDRDEMGICVEPPEFVIGLRRFEQYIFRTQPEGSRSGPGDLDLVVYSLRKWLRLALQGNPTVLLSLFVPEEEIVRITDLGRELRARPELVVSRQAGYKFLGYLRSQRGKMATGDRTVKHAMHMVRLGLQGVELLETGRITLPVPEPWRTWLVDLRLGRHEIAEAVEIAAGLEDELERLTVRSSLPERPDTALADKWLIDAYQRAWAELY